MNYATDDVMIMMMSTWRPSKKLSPMMMTVLPPVVQPSLGEMALMQGMAAVGYRPGYSAAAMVTMTSSMRYAMFDDYRNGDILGESH